MPKPKPQKLGKGKGWDNSVFSGGIDTMGFVELENDMMNMASRLSQSGANWPKTAASILDEAAQPVLEAALRFVKVRSGDLHDAIKVGKVVKRKGGPGYSIKIGNQSDSDVFYAAMVEFGHGGPKPAGPHAFMQPAYDTTKDQAYAIIRARLAEELSKIGG